MNSITGIITKYDGKGVYKIIDKTPLNRMNLGLLDGMTWDFGIDQSTSCTGLCFQSVGKEFQILLDVHRNQAIPKEIFYKDLYRFVSRTIRDKEIRMMISEKPAPKAMYASRVLEELKGHIDSWSYQMPELEEALMDSVFHQTWVSYVIDKSKGKNRSNDKRAVAEDIVDKFPLLQPYYLQYPWTDYDSFDATGILNGFLQYAFTEDGVEKIHGVKEKTHVSLIGYLWTKKGDQESLIDSFGGVQFWASMRPKFLVYNERQTLHDNIRMASSNYDLIYTVLPTNTLAQFEWKYDIDIEDSSMNMVMFVMRKGNFSNSDVHFFKSHFPQNEEVYNE